ncbi:hypothetical protein ATN84_06725 [Paramesorhizobium deserti]|uniref:DUF4167 domain-containing protein n=1 Tax=Paramesorhizobium deserti TaxID=1494590 RepID=A0A135I1T2_9HYPH|nr:DUF4167 domain-containing protein [Paramesorhizobium deserti]KXF79397.1 hypothetical protein ATN84_06725 [Paramesorhizobium deserti]
MRPGQQNRRMRGRGNNNRKGPNPLSRNYESNGPDVKIRGNAQHIAEKYATLARDAQASGDRVMAENYLQHAEHYNRIIMAAQAQAPVQFQREDVFDDDAGDDEDGFEQPTVAAAPKPVNGSGPQPVIEGTPAEVVYGEDGAETQKQPADRGRGQGRSQNRQRRPRNERAEAAPAAAEGEVEVKAEAAQQAAAPASDEAPVVANGAAHGEAEAAPAAEPRRPRRQARPRRTASAAADESGNGAAGDNDAPKAAEAPAARVEAGSDA